MNQYNFSLGGGFPLELDVFKEMQSSYHSLQVLGELAGNYAILQGCDRTGNNVSSGYVYYNGEVLPFKGGIATANAKVLINESPVEKRFEDGTKSIVLRQREMQFGTGVNAIAWSNFKKPKNTQSLTSDQANKEDKSVVNALAERVRQLEENQSNIPIGMVAIWGRSADQIPSGWQEYTGLKGLMPIGVDRNYDKSRYGDTVDWQLDNLGQSWGWREYILTEGQMPAHRHSSGAPFNKFAAKAYDYTAKYHVASSTRHGADNGDTGDEIALDNITNDAWREAEENSRGGNQPHPNMPPYKVVMFIEYVGN